MDTSELYSLVVDAVGNLFVAVGLIYAGRQIYFEKRAHMENHDWNRRLAAQEIIAQTDPVDVMMELSKKLDYSEREGPIPLAALLRLFEDDPSLRVNTIRLMNRFESLARGIYFGIYDENVVREAKRGVMIRIFRNFEEYVDYRREKLNPKSYNLWQAVVEKWEKGQLVSSNSTFNPKK